MTESMPPAASSGCLHVVATPIGNLGDLTYRAREVLASVDTVLAEDTRTTATLLAHYGIPAKSISLHEHNETRRAVDVIAAMQAGRSFALVSDAGTPGISDPGARLVAAVRAAGLTVVPVPGANAAVAALSVAGMEGPFVFLGFLPARSAGRRDALAPYAELACAIVLYEAPHRIRETIIDLAEVLGAARRILIAREITKRFESIELLPLGAALAWMDADPNRTRGEFVLVVEPAVPSEDDDLAEGERVLRILLTELSTKQAVSLAASITGARRNALYERALAVARSADPKGQGGA